MERVFQATRFSRDPAAQSVVTYLDEQESDLGLLDAVLYYDFPLFRDTENELHRSYLLLASRSHGVVLVNVTASHDGPLDVDDIRTKDDQIVQLYSIIFGMLLKSKVLRSGLREIKPSMTGILFAPNVRDVVSLEELDLTSESACSFPVLAQTISRSQHGTPLSGTEWAELRAIIEGAKGLIRPHERVVPDGDPNSPVAILAELESEIATFDLDQRRAALSIVDGPQRIRGLAGSGKTVVLAYKAAQLHLNNPQAHVLVTFYTKSLYDFVKRLITRFFRQYVDHDPDWDRIHVLHGWGGRNVDGVYHRACLDANISPISFKAAQQAGAATPFEYVCRELLDSGRVRPRYDYALIDEAQDFPSAFYRLCFELTRGGDIDRSVVWAYDELQNIFNAQIQSPRETFGMNGGQPVIDLDRAQQASGGYAMHDIVLHRCYRNPREILLTAHSLGFGIYSDTIVQTLQDEAHWKDVGYELVDGALEPGTDVVFRRPKENSPLSISARVAKEDIIKGRSFANMAGEVEWICTEIGAFVRGGLRPDDLMVICLDDRWARAYFERIAARLEEHDLDLRVNNVLANPYSGAVFIIEGAITLTTVYRAKGNEAAVVFAAGIDALLPRRRSRLGRNRLFTALTRAKGWLRVSGIRPDADTFLREIEQAMQNVPELLFTYPDPEEVETLQRDLSDRFVELDKVIRRLVQLDMLEEAEELLRARGSKAE
ncbi:MAG: ATP-binding domain-containing protein [Bryobacterales bacterium]|nr:ATP-binding domain-containing protein [Bryobacterales bacterium]